MRSDDEFPMAAQLRWGNSKPTTMREIPEDERMETLVLVGCEFHEAANSNDQ